MKKRSVAAVLLLPLVTFGIYGLVWQVKTKGEMNKLGAEIPTAWLLIIPFANIWWIWKYSEGVELVTKNKISTIMSFVLLWVLGSIGQAIVQHEFNQLDATTQGPVVATPAQSAQQPVQPTVQAPTQTTEPVAPEAPAAEPTAPTQTPPQTPTV